MSAYQTIFDAGDAVVSVHPCVASLLEDENFASTLMSAVGMAVLRESLARSEVACALSVVVNKKYPLLIDVSKSSVDGQVFRVLAFVRPLCRCDEGGE